MLHPLVGKKVKLKSITTTHHYPNLNIDATITHYELDDPEMESIIVLSTNCDVRIHLPTDLYPTDHDETRQNVYINEDGLIYEVSNG